MLNKIFKLRIEILVFIIIIGASISIATLKVSKPHHSDFNKKQIDSNNKFPNSIKAVPLSDKYESDKKSNNISIDEELEIEKRIMYNEAIEMCKITEEFLLSVKDDQIVSDKLKDKIKNCYILAEEIK